MKKNEVYITDKITIKEQDTLNNFLYYGNGNNFIFNFDGENILAYDENAIKLVKKIVFTKGFTIFFNGLSKDKRIGDCIYMRCLKKPFVDQTWKNIGKKTELEKNNYLQNFINDLWKKSKKNIDVFYSLLNEYEFVRGYDNDYKFWDVITHDNSNIPLKVALAVYIDKNINKDVSYWVSTYLEKSSRFLIKEMLKDELKKL